MTRHHRHAAVYTAMTLADAGSRIDAIASSKYAVQSYVMHGRVAGFHVGDVGQIIGTMLRGAKAGWGGL